MREPRIPEFHVGLQTTESAVREMSFFRGLNIAKDAKDSTEALLKALDDGFDDVWLMFGYAEGVRASVMDSSSVKIDFNNDRLNELWNKLELDDVLRR